ncbi:3-hydroxy-9,10-secoandrosta-1,3,5(10)-triene-9,17-dione monooxygenase oxygenase subunit [Streptomyces sp. NRRL S-1868]|uniref:3-hydroxy-9,10-secoandrosta-1,3,5(10)-triene-9, 17-dione monooxygenase oxygenase subunit n=1 Tax=Streptomyces sp. NRRL S-1868 TaxID=1463892 RepID=UPI00068F0699|nr:3-hydroxy-9,10-secoandrosta-1,3,5(10)-triene-9,17-dione monooxygenase oxygenase subunit [Streptomyces sp. NRRL S-1868]
MSTVTEGAHRDGGAGDDAGAAKVVDAVRDLAPVLRERADAAESAGRVPDESVAELAGTGFFRLLQPTAFGGLAADPGLFYTCVKEIARACGSTGWIASVLGVHNWQLGLFPEEAQREVWGGDDGARISSSYAPTGKVTPVEGGFRFSGRWSFSSGCEHADWVFLGGLIKGEDGAPVDSRTFLLPYGDYRIEKNWDTLGLRATGSHDIVVDDVFVPEHRTLSFLDTSALDCPGQRLNPEPLYRLPFAALFTSTIATPLVGIAEGAYATYVAVTRGRFRVSYGQKVKEDPFAHVRIARAGSAIDAAWLQLSHNIAELYGYAVRGEHIPDELRLRTRRDQVLATERAVEATDLLVENAGGNAMRTGHVVQRYWRDVHTGRGHVANDPERALTMFGRGELGDEVRDPML